MFVSLTAVCCNNSWKSEIVAKPLRYSRCWWNKSLCAYCTEVLVLSGFRFDTSPKFNQQLKYGWTFEVCFGNRFQQNSISIDCYINQQAIMFLQKIIFITLIDVIHNLRNNLSFDLYSKKVAKSYLQTILL